MFPSQEKSLLGIAAILAIFLSGCSANHYSIHRADHLDTEESVVIAVDAKQRLLLSNVITRPVQTPPSTFTVTEKTVQTPPDKSVITEKTFETKSSLANTEKLRRYCAEPSPDVFSVLSQSASGSGSFGQTADPKSVNIGLQFGFASGEIASTISRTQTINMLKEMMYRTCERYLNGQISDLEYPIIAARDQRIMASILAIEQLTGAALQKPVVIAAGGSASAGQSTSDAILRLDDANKRLAEKKDSLGKARKEFAEIDKPEGSCKTLMTKKPDEVTSEEEKKALKACIEKNANVEKAMEDVESAQAHYNAILGLAGKPGTSSATTSTSVVSPSPTTDIDKQIETIKSNTIKNVANVVNEIVSRSFKQEDETAFFCYRVIEKSANAEMSVTCLNFLTSKINKERAQLDLEAEKATRETKGLRYPTQ